jgi:inosine-uridine nucleoside N-ribohydrolase
MKEKAIDVILDTDMGPDCDDAGALAVLHALADQDRATVLGVLYCTSIPSGPGCVDAINRFYGRPDIPVGALAEEGFLRGHQYEKYAPYIAANFDHRFKTSRPPEAVSLCRQILSGRPDASVDIIGIGPMKNLAGILNSKADANCPQSGVELVGRTVRRLVVMGGGFAPDEKGVVPAEWNIAQDCVAAQTVMQRWPTPIVMCPSEAGGFVMTGKRLMAECAESNPVKKAYDIYTHGSGRNSWDLVTVYYAVCGESGIWELSEPGTIEINDQAVSRLCVHPDGRHRYVRTIAPVAQVEAVLEPLLIR